MINQSDIAIEFSSGDALILVGYRSNSSGVVFRSNFVGINDFLDMSNIFLLLKNLTHYTKLFLGPIVSIHSRPALLNVSPVLICNKTGQNSNFNANIDQ